MTDDRRPEGGDVPTHDDAVHRMRNTAEAEGPGRDAEFETAQSPGTQALMRSVETPDEKLRDPQQWGMLPQTTLKIVTGLCALGIEQMKEAREGLTALIDSFDDDAPEQVQGALVNVTEAGTAFATMRREIETGMHVPQLPPLDYSAERLDGPADFTAYPYNTGDDVAALVRDLGLLRGGLASQCPPSLVEIGRHIDALQERADVIARQRGENPDDGRDAEGVVRSMRIALDVDTAGIVQRVEGLRDLLLRSRNFFSDLHAGRVWNRGDVDEMIDRLDAALGIETAEDMMNGPDEVPASVANDPEQLGRAVERLDAERRRTRLPMGETAAGEDPGADHFTTVRNALDAGAHYLRVLSKHTTKPFTKGEVERRAEECRSALALLDGGTVSVIDVPRGRSLIEVPDAVRRALAAEMLPGDDEGEGYAAVIRRGLDALDSEPPLKRALPTALLDQAEEGMTAFAKIITEIKRAAETRATVDLNALADKLQQEALTPISNPLDRLRRQSERAVPGQTMTALDNLDAIHRDLGALFEEARSLGDVHTRFEDRLRDARDTMGHALTILNGVDEKGLRANGGVISPGRYGEVQRNGLCAFLHWLNRRPVVTLFGQDVQDGKVIAESLITAFLELTAQNGGLTPSGSAAPHIRQHEAGSLPIIVPEDAAHELRAATMGSDAVRRAGWGKVIAAGIEAITEGDGRDALRTGLAMLQDAGWMTEAEAVTLINLIERVVIDGQDRTDVVAEMIHLRGDGEAALHRVTTTAQQIGRMRADAVRGFVQWGIEGRLFPSHVLDAVDLWIEWQDAPEDRRQRMRNTRDIIANRIPNGIAEQVAEARRKAEQKRDSEGRVMLPVGPILELIDAKAATLRARMDQTRDSDATMTAGEVNGILSEAHADLHQIRERFYQATYPSNGDTTRLFGHAFKGIVADLKLWLTDALDAFTEAHPGENRGVLEARKIAEILDEAVRHHYGFETVPDGPSVRVLYRDLAMTLAAVEQARDCLAWIGNQGIPATSGDSRARQKDLETVVTRLMPYLDGSDGIDPSAMDGDDPDGPEGGPDEDRPLSPAAMIKHRDGRTVTFMQDPDGETPYQRLQDAREAVARIMGGDPNRTINGPYVWQAGMHALQVLNLLTGRSLQSVPRIDSLPINPQPGPSAGPAGQGAVSGDERAAQTGALIFDDPEEDPPPYGVSSVRERFAKLITEIDSDGFDDDEWDEMTGIMEDLNRLHAEGPLPAMGSEHVIIPAETYRTLIGEVRNAVSGKTGKLFHYAGAVPLEIAADASDSDAVLLPFGQVKRNERDGLQVRIDVIGFDMMRRSMQKAADLLLELHKRHFGEDGAHELLTAGENLRTMLAGSAHLGEGGGTVTAVPGVEAITEARDRLGSLLAEHNGSAIIDKAPLFDVLGQILGLLDTGNADQFEAAPESISPGPVTLGTLMIGYPDGQPPQVIGEITEIDITPEIITEDTGEQYPRKRYGKTTTVKATLTRTPSISGEATQAALPVIEDPQTVPGMGEAMRQAQPFEQAETPGERAERIMTEHARPPRGLKPRLIHDCDRAEQILLALGRRLRRDDGTARVPTSREMETADPWIEELQHLFTQIRYQREDAEEGRA